MQDAAGTIVDLSGNTDQVKLLDRSGKIITASGNPTFGFGIDRDAARFNPFRLTRGRWAAGADEVVIDADTASAYHFAPGDTIRAAGAGARWRSPPESVVGRARVRCESPTSRRSWAASRSRTVREDPCPIIGSWTFSLAESVGTRL